MGSAWRTLGPMVPCLLQWGTPLRPGAAFHGGYGDLIFGTCLPKDEDQPTNIVDNFYLYDRHYKQV